MSYFEQDIPLRPEIVAGLFRESQIVTLAGPFNVGKSPLLADIASHVARGLPWCGRPTLKRPVVHFDFESSDPAFRRTYRNICKGQSPVVPDEVEPYVLNSSHRDERTALLTKAGTSYTGMIALLNSILERKPNALLIFDPIELAFPIEFKKPNVLKLYGDIRRLFSRFSQATTLSTHNLRKIDRRAVVPDLLRDPHGWLEEISGTLDIVNRSDVRIGMARYSEGISIVNGARRNEEMHPLLLAPVDDNPDELAGFRPITSKASDLTRIFTDEQLAYWKKLPDTFHFVDFANNGIPKSSLSRLINRAVSVGILTRNDGELIKLL